MSQTRVSGSAQAVGAFDGSVVGPEVGEVVGLSVGCEIAGLSVGDCVGGGVGLDVSGLFVGVYVGDVVGPLVGEVVGRTVGASSHVTISSPQGSMPFQECVTRPTESVMATTRYSRTSVVDGSIRMVWTVPLTWKSMVIPLTSSLSAQ